MGSRGLGGEQTERLHSFGPPSTGTPLPADPLHSTRPRHPSPPDGSSPSLSRPSAFILPQSPPCLSLANLPLLFYSPAMAALKQTILFLSLLWALLGLTTSQLTTNYSVLYIAYPSCDLTVDGSGFVYVLLCEGGVVKFNSSGSPLTSFETQYSNALATGLPSSNYTAPLYSELVRVGVSGTVWTLDYFDAQLVGVSNVSSPNATVSVISTLSEEDSLDFSIAPDSDTLWLLFESLSAVPVQQLSPQGAVLQQWGPSNVPGLVNYWVWGIYAAAGGVVYLGGCYPSNAFLFYYLDDEGYIQGWAPSEVQGCDVRQFSANGTLLQTFRPVLPSTNYFNMSWFTSVVVDNTGAVFALDTYNGYFYKWTSNGTQSVLVNDTNFYDLAVSPSGVVYAPTYSDAFAVVTVNPANLSALSSFEISSQTFAEEQAVALSPDGRLLYATSYDGTYILTLNTSSGAPVGRLGMGLLADCQYVATDSSGNLYVSDTSVDVVYKLALNGSLLLTFSSALLGEPLGVAVNPLTNEVVVADYGNGQLVVFSQSGAVARTIDTSQFVTPSDNPQYDPSYYSYYYSAPLDVKVSPTGTIVFVDVGLYDVVILAASGNATTLYNSAVVSYQVFGYPYGLALSNDNRIFVANLEPNGVYTFSMSGTLLNTLIYSEQGLYIYGLAYNPLLNLLYGADDGNNQIVSFSAAAPPALNGSLCALLYGLPGNVDYPWSVSVSLQFQYLRTAINNSYGTAVQLVSGSGSRVFTNRFGLAITSAITLGVTYSTDNLLYLNQSSPVDNAGITYGLLGDPVQLPGNGPRETFFMLSLLNATGYIAENSATRVDNAGTAFLSTVPGFRNLTIGASNINSLAINYAACKAPLTFTNGLRTPTQPSASNGAVRFLYSYNISDGATYSVYANLTITASSAFATTQDLLGNPYQTVTNITGIRVYTYLRTGARVVSTVRPYSFSSPADQRFYPYALLASAPGVYTQNTAPFLDNDGLVFNFSPAGPTNGAVPSPNTSPNSTASTIIHMVTSLTTAVLTEYFYLTLPSPTFQQQSLQLL